MSELLFSTNIHYYKILLLSFVGDVHVVHYGIGRAILKRSEPMERRAVLPFF